MDFINEIRRKFDQIDFSDFRLLFIGAILVVLPILFLAFYSKPLKPQDRHKNTLFNYAITENRKGFSYISNSSGSKRMFSSAPAIYSEKKANSQWQQAIEKAQKSEALPYEIQMLPKEKRDIWEANYDPQIRRANYELECGNFEEAMKQCKDILDRDTDNLILKFQASGNLCSIYEKLGQKDAYEKEFQRYLTILNGIKFPGFSPGPILAGIRAMQKLAGNIPKMRVQPQVRAAIEKSLAESGLSGKMSVDEVLNQTEVFFLQLGRGMYQGGNK